MRAGFVALLLLIGAAAGCLTSEPKGFEAEPVPVWQAGYTWTYDMATSFSSNMFGERSSESESATARLTVTNTTATVQGRPAYFLEINGTQTEFAQWGGSLIAVSQDQLKEIAHGGSTDHYYGHRYAYSSDVEYLEEEFQCAPANSVYAGSSAFPDFLKFPLTSKAKWSGRTTEQWDGPNLDYAAEVVGRERITVPAGTFDAIHVSLRLTPVANDRSEFDPMMGNMQASMDLWYAPEVTNVVKHTMKASFGSLFPPASFSVTFEMTLGSYALDVKPAKPAPVVRTESDQTWRSMSVVNLEDQAPRIVGDAPATLRLGLEEGTSDRRYGSLTASTGKNLSYDSRFYVPVWQLYGAGEGMQFAGDVLETEITQPGRYSVSVSLRSLECGGGTIGGAHAMFGVGQDLFLRADPEPGVPGERLTLGNFTLWDSTGVVNVSWMRSQTFDDDSLDGLLENGFVEDEGRALLRNSKGEADGTGSDPVVHKGLRPGLWDVVWETAGPRTALGPAPRTLGHDYDVLVSIDFPTERPEMRPIPMPISEPYN